jgi:hypothetical protein
MSSKIVTAKMSTDEWEIIRNMFMYGLIHLTQKDQDFSFAIAKCLYKYANGEEMED